MARAKKDPTEGADSVLVYFDRKAYPGRNSQGAWVTLIKRNCIVTREKYETEEDAMTSLGLPDGNPDPEYRPKAGRTGVTVVI